MKKGSFILVQHFVEGKSENSKGGKFKNSQLVGKDFYEKFNERFHIL